MLDARSVERLRGTAPLTFPAVFALAALHFAVSRRRGAGRLCLGWLENQVIAALSWCRSGQGAGQRMLAALGAGFLQSSQRA